MFKQTHILRTNNPQFPDPVPLMHDRASDTYTTALGMLIGVPFRSKEHWEAYGATIEPVAK